MGKRKKNSESSATALQKNGTPAVSLLSSENKISNFVIFQTATGKVNIDVFFQNETLWLTQKKMAELFEKGRTTITEHLKNIFSERELDENSVCRDFRHTAEDGKLYSTKYYNLKAITAVGYRVNSHRATEFRKWATEILHEYIIKGFAMDDERLKHRGLIGHYVAILEVQDNNVIIGDPLSGIKTLSKEKLAEKWKNTVIELSLTH